jgi:hypothetical protein
MENLLLVGHVFRITLASNYLGRSSLFCHRFLISTTRKERAQGWSRVFDSLSPEVTMSK